MRSSTALIIVGKDQVLNQTDNLIQSSYFTCRTLCIHVAPVMPLRCIVMIRSCIDPNFQTQARPMIANPNPISGWVGLGCSTLSDDICDEYMADVAPH